MSTNGPVVMQVDGGPARLLPSRPTVLPSSAHFRTARNQRRKPLVAGFITLLAGCLALGFVAFIVLEAFDSDPDLYAYGAEEFLSAPQDSLDASLQPARVFSALEAMRGSIMTAGACLILMYRARSALASDSLAISSVFDLAEPRGRP